MTNAWPVVPADAWQNPLVFAVNRLPARSMTWPHPDAVSAARSPGSDPHSPWLRCISGDWKFNWVNEPAQAPANFAATNFDDAAWPAIPVPGCVELYGHGTPLYVNYVYPFKVDPPRVMGAPATNWTFFADRNPTSSYRRWVDVPGAWHGQRVYLHVGAAGSCLTVWVNGHCLGYSEDSRLAAEFDITAAVHPGPNLIALQVLRVSDASYLEDQDLWRLSGIFRNVYLFTRPNLHLWDVAVESQFNPGPDTAAVKLRFQAVNDGDAPAGNLSARLTLLAPDGSRVPDFRLDSRLTSELAPGAQSECLSAAVDLPKVQPWTFETPQLYTAVVEFRQADRTLEAIAMRIGFRQVALKHQEFTLNGRPVKIHGVNRHDWDPATGYVVPEATLREDIRLMKQAHFNAVRASHYPNDPRFVELCDELGLMVLSEANLESHGLSYHKCVLPGDLPEWQSAAVERIRRLVIRERSHPSVVMWSLGNEAGYGSAFDAMAAEARRLDGEHRPLHYADMNAPCDVDSQTYPTPQWLELHVAGKAVRNGEHGEIAEFRQHGHYPTGKPFLMNEFAWAGGNGVGNYRDYWNVIDRHPLLIGGFIWDWADKGLAAALVAGRPTPWLGVASRFPAPSFYAVGGDFGDQPNDGNFVLTGLLASDRRPKPAYQEVATVNQPVRVCAVDLAHGALRIENHYYFSDLTHLVATWKWSARGMPDVGGRLPALSCRPGQACEVRVPPPSAGEDRCLTVQFALAQATGWAGAGFTVAREQLAMDGPPALTQRVLDPGAVRVKSSEHVFTLSSPQFIARIGKRSGMLESLRYGGRDLIAQPWHLCFWRPPTTNDRGWKMPAILGAWRKAGEQTTATGITLVQNTNGTVTVAAELAIPVGASHATIEYQVAASGRLVVHASFMLSPLGTNAPADEIPRIGLQGGLIAPLHHLAWWGLGPEESYADRQDAALLGAYQADALTWNQDYQPPQETGHRSGIRTVLITSPGGQGLLVRAVHAPLGINLWPWTAEDLEKAVKPQQLKTRDFLTLTLDCVQMGLGGVQGWGARPLKPYLVPAAQPRQLDFTLEPARPDSIL